MVAPNPLVLHFKSEHLHSSAPNTQSSVGLTSRGGLADGPPARIGLGICYDIRFPDLAALYRHLGCNMLVYPGAFNMVTGPAHWELLIRARSVDNQVCGPAPSSAVRFPRPPDPTTVLHPPSQSCLSMPAVFRSALLSST
jgi:hypothetical protein